MKKSDPCVHVTTISQILHKCGLYGRVARKRPLLKKGTLYTSGMAVLTMLAERLGAPDGWRSDRQVSGEQVRRIASSFPASKYLISPQHILLIHDELDKPLGKFGIKHGVSRNKNVLDTVMKQSVDVLLTYITDSQPQTSPAEGRSKNKARTLSPPQDTTEEQKQS
uniref:Uncharacterized protein n=1 Tax=Sinocyclocheilus grahami TaxID=75366 RepID=A0A672NG61_SINGR